MFRFNGKRVFLTYPRCAAPKESLLEYAKTAWGAKWALVSTEKHADGTLHLHALIQWERRIDTKNQRFFDWGEYHPNIQSPKNWAACKTYVRKDGDWVESDDVEENYFEMAKGMNREQWISYCIGNKIAHGYCMMIWHEITDANTIREFEAEAEWIRGDLAQYKWDDLYQGKALQIKGASGIGKTTWAKVHAPKPSLMVNHIDALKQFRAGYHKSIIFDDMSFLHMPREAQIMLLDADNPRQIHVRYGIVQIPARVPKVFTSNVKIFEEDDLAIARRLNKHSFI